MSEPRMNEKELRRELRRVRHKETEILARSRYRKVISLESILNRYLPDSLEQTLDNAFREAFRLIFSKGTAVIGKTFNEKKLRESDSPALESQKRWATDMLMTSVEGTGLGLIGVGLPDIPVFTGMLLRAVYQTAVAYQFEYTTKTEQVFILKLIEAALTRGKKAEKLSSELDELMRQIDEEGFEYYGNLNKQIERASKALSDETLYLKFVQTVPVVGIAGGLSNPIYMNKVKAYAEVKYHKRRLLIQLRAARGEVKAPEEQTAAPEAIAAPDGTEDTAVTAAPEAVPEHLQQSGPAAAAEAAPPETGPQLGELTVSVYDPDGTE